jgi:hypothetical protein
MHILYINILISYVFYMFRTRGLIFGKTVLYTVSMEHTLLYKRLPILMCVKHTIPYNTCIYNQISEDEPLG